MNVIEASGKMPSPLKLAQKFAISALAVLVIIELLKKLLVWLLGDLIGIPGAEQAIDWLFNLSSFIASGVGAFGSFVQEIYELAIGAALISLLSAFGYFLLACIALWVSFYIIYMAISLWR